MKKRDAMERLLEHVDGVRREFLRGRSIKQVHAKTRRLVRALLKERADAARDAATGMGLTAELNALSYKSASVLAHVIRAAVLRAPKRGKK
jgi:hypothetical protein